MKNILKDEMEEIEAGAIGGTACFLTGFLIVPTIVFGSTHSIVSIVKDAVSCWDS